MTRIEVDIAAVRATIAALYQPATHHFITMNGLDLGDSLELQWFFSPYGQRDQVQAVVARVAYDQEVESLSDLIPSLWVSECELRDLLGVRIKGARSGVFLEPDAAPQPLRKQP